VEGESQLEVNIAYLRTPDACL